MGSLLKLVLLLAAVTLAFTNSAVAGLSTTPLDTTDGVQVIDVTAKKYEFNPSPIRVKQGTKVQLKITAMDHAHGFRIAEFPEGADRTSKPGLVFPSGPNCSKIEKGQTETVEFVAQTPGTYSFKCCVHCGWRHREMKGELIVEP